MGVGEGATTLEERQTVWLTRVVNAAKDGVGIGVGVDEGRSIQTISEGAIPLPPDPDPLPCMSCVCPQTLGQTLVRHGAQKVV